MFKTKRINIFCKILSVALLCSLQIEANAAVPFGFFASSMNGVGKGEYSSQVKDISNFVHIRGADLNEVIQKINLAKKQKLKFLLHVQNIFFPWHSSELSSNWQEQAKSILEAIKPYQNDLIGFYLFDEPYWANIQPGWISVPSENLRNNLDISASFLKSMYPNTPVVLTFAYKEVDKNLLIPTKVDYLGVNCYYAFGNICSESEVLRYRDILKRKLNHKQKLVYTVDAYINRPPNAEIESKLTSRLKFLDKIIQQDLNEKRLGMLLPFLFQTHQIENLYGVDQMPVVKKELMKMFLKYSSEKND